MTENDESVSSGSASSETSDLTNKSKVKEEKPIKPKETTRSKGTWISNRRRNGHQQATTKITEPNFKGTTVDMNGHTFQ